jgi:alkanesulfonate monooxygenase SsuD/methylene tetrahydromethanopterin reductase-like flavin-dependent oxidoreductase (luciferase family)
MLPQIGASFADMLSFARRAEALGFDGGFCIDHMWPIPDPALPIPECWTALAAITACTERLRVGTLVTRTTVRNPALLAKMAATVDEIGGGRLILGVGTGDDLNHAENTGYGLPFFEAKQRVASLREFLEVVSLLWREDRATLEGTYFQLHQAALYPKPVQRPRPPIWVGGRSPAIRRIAAAQADAWNAWGVTPEELAQGAAEVAEHARAAGRAPEEVAVTWAGHVIVADTQAAVDAAVERFRRSDKLSKNIVTGTPEECVARLDAYRRAGASWLVCEFPRTQRQTGVTLFAERVLPELHRLAVPAQKQI